MTDEMRETLDAIVEVAEANGWTVDIEEQSSGKIELTFYQYSPAGHDLWLDSDGHGKNGAPYHMRDLLEDMEACETMLEDLSIALANHKT